ncbi:MAG: hypothetical protein HFP76_01415, partial [Methylococcales symbiont of Iophon sp. n. MRB-2018]
GQSYCISTILGGQRLFQTILLHFHHPWRSEIVPDNLTAFPPSLAVRDCSRQSYCISTILGGQRLFQTILLHFHHPWRSEIVPDNLTAFPPSLTVSRSGAWNAPYF